jgi:hypothetical protein
MARRNSNDLRLKSHYKMYCKILSNVIKEAKWINYNNQILASNNKIKTSWAIVKLELGRKTINVGVQSLNIVGMFTTNPQAIGNAFNEYFLTLVETKYINNNNINNDNNDEDSYDDDTNNNGDSGGIDNSPNRDNNRNTLLSYLLDAFNN